MRFVNLAARSNDAYIEGMRIAAGLTDLDGPNVNPLCRTRLYTHGHRTERALLLLHGFTNCPQQFDALGKRFHDDGWNVLIPRMFGLQGLPGPGAAALAQLAFLLPNYFIWWDRTLKDRRGPAHAYPRFATHAYAALFRTAGGVLDGGRKEGPQAP